MLTTSIAWLSKLVAFDTTSINSNLPMIEAMREWFDLHQMTSRLIYNVEKDKANIFATLPAADGSEQGGIIFSGHTDVVPVVGQQWHTDPFISALIDNKIFGRGTSDMKGFLAVVMALIPEFRQMKLPFPIHCAFSFDEEVGCRGIASLIETIQKLKINPVFCIVGEPTMMNYVVAHKGIQSYRCQVHGLAKHSSLTPLGCNAINYAANIIEFLQGFAEKLQLPTNLRDERYDVPYSTISANMIRGGVAHNVIPDFCEIGFEFRNLPNMKPSAIAAEIESYIATLRQKMRKKYADAAINIEQVSSSPSFASSVDLHNFLPLSSAISVANKPQCVAYATEAGYFEQAGIKTLICGPGSINQAHQADEYLAVDQLAKCEGFLLRLVRYYVSGYTILV